MTKKICIAALIVFLVSLVAGAVLAPIAIADIAESTGPVNQAHSQMEERFSLSAEGIKTVSFDNGSYIRTMRIKPSPDDQIHVWSDGYVALSSQFSYAMNSEMGHLEVGRYEKLGHDSVSWLSRSNLPLMLARAFNRETPSVELYLPQGVAYDMDSWSVGMTEVDPEVEVYYAHQTGEYNQLEEAPIVPPDAEPAAPEEHMPDVPVSETDIRKIAVERATESNGALLEAARDYAETGDEQAFWDAVSPIISELAGLYAEQAMLADGAVWQGIDLQSAFEQYMTLQTAESLLELKQERLEKAYRDGLILKVDFYEQDLELDSEQELLEEERDAMEEMEELLERIERSNGVTTLLVEGFDADRAGL